MIKKVKRFLKKYKMIFFRYFDGGRFWLGCKLILLVALMLWSFQSLGHTFSLYETSASSSANATVAFYMIDAQTSTNTISLGSIVPRDEPYVYTFLVSNHDSQNRTEVTLDYQLSLITTTNLPLQFALYKDATYTDESAVQLITSTEEKIDSYGTYFRTMKTDTTYQFSHLQDETHVYNLVVWFPSEYQNGHDLYQGVIEGIRVVVDATQVISSS